MIARALFALALAIAIGLTAAPSAAQSPVDPPGFDAPIVPKGPGTYRAGPLTIHLRHAPEVQFLCANVAHVGKPGDRLIGCYIPSTQTIVAPVDDAAAFVHELKHHFEGAWHP